MSDTPAANLDTAFRLIDSITTIRGVLGAMVVDVNGEVVAQDFISQVDQERGWPIGAELIPQLNKGSRALRFGELDNAVLQFSKLLVRVLRRDRTMLVVFAEHGINLGMLNVDLRERIDVLETIASEAIADEREKERDRIFNALRSRSGITPLIESRVDLPSLRALHGLMFQTALDLGVPREQVTAKMNDINYRIYRDSLLDIGFDFFNRKTLDNYDPQLARKVVSTQIEGMAEMMVAKLPE